MIARIIFVTLFVSLICLMLSFAFWSMKAVGDNVGPSSDYIQSPLK